MVSWMVQVLETWERFVGPDGSNLTREHARHFYRSLDHSHVLGWAPHKTKKPPCYNKYVEVRPAHPQQHAICYMISTMSCNNWRSHRAESPEGKAG